MLRGVSQRVWRAAAFAVLLAGIAGAGPLFAAPIATESSGAFGVCLQARADGWTKAAAERLANDDPTVSAISDAAVATWAARAIDTCKRESGRSDAASEDHFVKFMARWRESIDSAAQQIRLRGGAD
jgi:hypothetical protein